jgi:hypothetical protein
MSLKFCQFFTLKDGNTFIKFQSSFISGNLPVFLIVNATNIYENFNDRNVSEAACVSPQVINR